MSIFLSACTILAFLEVNSHQIGRVKLHVLPSKKGKVLSWYLHERTRENHAKPVRIDALPAQIQTRHFPNTVCQKYHPLNHTTVFEFNAISMKSEFT
jgi:hypothetical protein